MNKFMLTLLSVGLMSSGAALAEPLSLTDSQMDQVTAASGPFDGTITLDLSGPDDVDLYNKLTDMSAVTLIVPINWNDGNQVPPTPLAPADD